MVGIGLSLSRREVPGRALGERPGRPPGVPPAARRAHAGPTTTRADPTAPDRSTPARPRCCEGYEFDRVGYRIAGSTFRSTDLTHWLALDVAARALADAGFPAARACRGDSTGVVVGNTLTGEFTRANLHAAALALRPAHGRRRAARGRAGTTSELGEFLTRLEARYKAPFPPIDEDTLAGGLSNTIAGRICNYFDFGGGGYTVDGACSSSLLSVATACKALAGGDLDVAVAGGVDLSHRPVRGRSGSPRPARWPRPRCGSTTGLQRLLARRGLRHASS